MSNIKYNEISFSDINFKNNNLVLLITATGLETEYLHKELKPFDIYDSILQVHQGNYTYYLGLFGNYLAVHVQCGTMGSISRDSSITTISDAISIFKPKITLMIGIAFGVNEIEQNIGDVLVSECISPYNFKKVQDGIDTLRTNDAPASKLLLNRFKNAFGWEFLLNNNIKAKIITGPILSGEELINDINRRNELVKAKPTAKGGEMEGIGLHSAADGKCEWILIKGICDFADGNKDSNKELNQVTAIRSALSLCKEVFLSQTAFESIDLKPLKASQTEIKQDNNQNINQVLFDRYDNTKENYYLNREIDNKIIANLKLYSLWVYGKSGRGKSNIVLRNIINQKFEHVIISLASCNGLSIDDFFKEILIELTEKLDVQVKSFSNINFQQSIKEIIALLDMHYKDKEVYIIIDEIPIGDDENCKVFTDKICSLFISNTMYSNCAKIKYVLSSIYSPINHISDFNQKVYETVKFIEIYDWEKVDCNNLINLIEDKLDLSIQSKVKEEIIKSSNGSPRFIKKAFKNSFALGGLEIENYNNVIVETKRELNRY
jgi:nucleoside phosphorylase